MISALLHKHCHACPALAKHTGEHPQRAGVHRLVECRAVMDWVCVCADLESSSRVQKKEGAMACVAWAPLMGRKAECIAVARGNVVRLFSLQGHMQHSNANENLQAEQVRDLVCAAASTVCDLGCWQGCEVWR
jgi:hypothetical protein